eukprot:8916328-Alexandrium_andersonii.AAC.1
MPRPGSAPLLQSVAPDPPPRLAYGNVGSGRQLLDPAILAYQSHGRLVQRFPAGGSPDGCGLLPAASDGASGDAGTSWTGASHGASGGGTAAAVVQRNEALD